MNLQESWINHEAEEWRNMLLSCRRSIITYWNIIGSITDCYLVYCVSGLFVDSKNNHSLTNVWMPSQVSLFVIQSQIYPIILL